MTFFVNYSYLKKIKDFTFSKHNLKTIQGTGEGDFYYFLEMRNFYIS